MTNNECIITFNNYKDKIRTIFATPYILKCHNINGMTVYKDIFELPMIENLMKNSDIIETSVHFLNNDLNLTQAAKNSFMHRNTMIYRIKKLSQITGLDIKKFEDAVIYSNMLTILEMLKSTTQK